MILALRIYLARFCFFGQGGLTGTAADGRERDAVRIRTPKKIDAPVGKPSSPQASLGVLTVLKGPMALGLKLILYFVAWGMVLMHANPADLWGAPFFPLGLIAVFSGGANNAIIAWMMVFPILLGWLFYGLLSLIMFRTKRTWVWVLVYAFFCVALALNIEGCKKTLEAVHAIQ